MTRIISEKCFKENVCTGLSDDNQIQIETKTHQRYPS